MTFIPPSVTAFTVNPDKPLKDEAARAVNLICKHGVAIWNGAVGPGGANTFAASAAKAFTKAQVTELKDSADPVAQGLGNIIGLRQTFERTNSNKPLEKIVAQIEALAGEGWKPSAPISRHAHPKVA